MAEKAQTFTILAAPAGETPMGGPLRGGNAKGGNSREENRQGGILREAPRTEPIRARGRAASREPGGQPDREAGPENGPPETGQAAIRPSARPSPRSWPEGWLHLVSAYDSLPFVQPSADGGGSVFWAPRPTGDHLRDCGVGAAYARALLAVLRAEPDGPSHLLAFLLQDLARHGDAQRDRGVLAGMATVLSDALRAPFALPPGPPSPAAPCALSPPAPPPLTPCSAG